MQRRCLSLLLILSLLFGQSMESVHIFTHLQTPQQTDPCAAPINVEQCSHAHDVCPECLMLAALAVAAPLIIVVLLPACARRWHFPLIPRSLTGHLRAAAVHNRGPPSVPAL